MKIALLLIALPIISFAQSKSLSLRGTDIELGMGIRLVWGLIDPQLNVLEDDTGNLYISDKYDNAIGIIFFKDEKVVKVVKDWGTTYKSNVGQVFKVLWKL